MKPKRLRAEDFPGTPEWFAPFLDALNDAMTSIADAVFGGLTAGKHLMADVITVPLLHGEATDVAMRRLQSAPIGVFVVASPGGQVDSFGWGPSEKAGAVSVTVSWAVDPGEETEVTLLMLGR